MDNIIVIDADKLNESNDFQSELPNVSKPNQAVHADGDVSDVHTNVLAMPSRKRKKMDLVSKSVDKKNRGDLWSCHACTFLNHPSIKSCEICSTCRKSAKVAKLASMDPQDPVNRPKVTNFTSQLSDVSYITSDEVFSTESQHSNASTRMLKNSSIDTTHATKPSLSFVSQAYYSADSGPSDDDDGEQMETSEPDAEVIHSSLNESLCSVSNPDTDVCTPPQRTVAFKFQHTPTTRRCLSTPKQVHDESETGISSPQADNSSKDSQDSDEFAKAETIAAQLLFSPSKRRNRSHCSSEQWICLNCEFLNDSYTDICDGCLEAKPEPSTPEVQKGRTVILRSLYWNIYCLSHQYDSVHFFSVFCIVCVRLLLITPILIRTLRNLYQILLMQDY